MFIILWDVKEPTHYIRKRIGHGVPGVAVVLFDCMSHRIGALNLEPRSVVLRIHIRLTEGARLVKYIDLGKPKNGAPWSSPCIFTR